MRSFLVLLILLAGLGVWFWLLLREDAPQRAPVERVEVTEEEPASVEQATEVRFEIPEDAPPQTDVGMEFPVLDSPESEENR